MSVQRSPPSGGRGSQTPSAFDAPSDDEMRTDCFVAPMTPTRLRTASDSVIDTRKGTKRPPTSPLQEREGKRSTMMSDIDIWAIKDELAGVDQTFAQINATSKESSARKKDLDHIIATYRRAVDRITMAYMQIKAEKDATMKIWEIMRKEVAERYNTKDPVTAEQSGATRRLYAEAVRASDMAMHPNERSDVPSHPLETIEVAPAKENESKFRDSVATRDAMYAAINPRELGIKINRVIPGRNKSVRVVARKDELDKVMTVLDKVGLESKRFDKMNPRLMVKDIPGDMAKDNFLGALVQQNLKGRNQNEIKLIYWSHGKDRIRATNAVIEVPPEIRTEILNQGRIYIGWSACRVSDHLRVVQCFRCLSFGHTAKDCKATAASCGFCNGEHEMRDCTDKTVLNCHSCLGAKMKKTDHAAFDRDRCPVLRRKLDERSKSIRYK